jgi:hypothetical protein
MRKDCARAIALTSRSAAIAKLSGRDGGVAQIGNDPRAVADRPVRGSRPGHPTAIAERLSVGSSRRVDRNCELSVRVRRPMIGLPQRPNVKAQIRFVAVPPEAEQFSQSDVSIDRERQ